MTWKLMRDKSKGCWSREDPQTSDLPFSTTGLDDIFSFESQHSDFTITDDEDDEDNNSTSEERSIFSLYSLSRSLSLDCPSLDSHSNAIHFLFFQIYFFLFSSEISKILLLNKRIELRTVASSGASARYNGTAATSTTTSTTSSSS